MPQPDTNPALNNALRDLFQTHGVEATQHGGWVLLPESGTRASASLLQEIARPTGFTVELEVRFEFVQGRTIVEAFAGLGGDKGEAVTDAFGTFAANTFHVLLAAFLQPKQGDAPGADGQESREEWLLGGQTRRVTVGNLGVRGRPPVQGEQLLGWFDQFQSAIQQQTLGPETHWVRLYYGQMQGEALACEVLLDNEAWAEVQAQAASFAWPSGEAFYGLRLFLVIEGVDGGSPPAGPPAAPTAPEGEATVVRAKSRSWRFWER